MGRGIICMVHYFVLLTLKTHGANTAPVSHETFFIIKG